MKFLNKEFNRWVRSQTFKSDKIDSCKGDECKSTRSTVSALHCSSLSVKNTKKCLYCQKGHLSASCWALDKSFDERKAKITKLDLGCFMCLSRSHTEKGCMLGYGKCNTAPPLTV